MRFLLTAPTDMQIPVPAREPASSRQQRAADAEREPGAGQGVPPAVLPCARPGDVIDVVAPASACRKEELAAGAAVLEEWGFRPRIPSDLFLDRGIVAAPDEARYAILDRAFSSPDSPVVWCVRGGYGSARLLPRQLRYRPPPKC